MFWQRWVDAHFTHTHVDTHTHLWIRVLHMHFDSRARQCLRVRWTSSIASIHFDVCRMHLPDKSIRFLFPTDIWYVGDILSCDTSKLYIFFFENFNDNFLFFWFRWFFNVWLPGLMYIGTGKFKLRVSRKIYNKLYIFKFYVIHE